MIGASGVRVTIGFDTDVHAARITTDRCTNPKAIVPANLIVLRGDDFEALRHDRMWSNVLPVEIHLIEGV